MAEQMKLNLETISLTHPRPILKWAGGKQQLLSELISRTPKKFNRYIEPFFGGGALFFALQPPNSIISESNTELINLYRIASENVEELIETLLQFKISKECFYNVRSQDFDILSPDEVISIPAGEAPAYFEWVLWRAFLTINSLTNKPWEARRFKIDQDFLPVAPVPGRCPDHKTHVIYNHVLIEISNKYDNICA